MNDSWRINPPPRVEVPGCSWCAAGFSVCVNNRTGERLHDLPEPGGMIACGPDYVPVEAAHVPSHPTDPFGPEIPWLES